MSSILALEHPLRYIHPMMKEVLVYGENTEESRRVLGELTQVENITFSFVNRVEGLESQLKHRQFDLLILVVGDRFSDGLANVISKMSGRSTWLALAALMLAAFSSGAVFAGDPGAFSTGLQAWSIQSRRAPHPVFSGREYFKNEWPIIMAQMAWIGQMGFDETQAMATYLLTVAPPASETEGFAGWVKRHFVFPGYARLSAEQAEETTTSLAATHLIIGLFEERWLVQVEPEITVQVTPDIEAEVELEYAHLTYFLGDQVQVTAGKILSDFNFSNVRLHPSWINLSQDQPWAALIVPSSTLGGRVSWSAQLGSASLGVLLFGGGGPGLVGARSGIFFTEEALELGLSAAAIRESGDTEPTLGAYAIKRWSDLKLHGEVVRNTTSGQGAYWLEASHGLRAISDDLERFTPVLRWQQYRPGTVAAQAPTGGHGHVTFPGGSARELYFGMNYDFLRSARRYGKFQLGYAAGLGSSAENRAITGITLRW